MKKLVLVGMILIVGVAALSYIHILPVPIAPIQFNGPSAALSTAGSVCQFSALYFDAGYSILQGIATGGGLVDGAQSGVQWLQNGMSTNQWGPANPYNCPP